MEGDLLLYIQVDGLRFSRSPRKNPERIFEEASVVFSQARPVVFRPQSAQRSCFSQA